MSEINAAAIQSLRARTGVSITACRDALVEANGDEEKAIEILRKRGIAQAAKKAERDQSEGLVFLKEAEGRAAVVLLRCETDFVARDANFQEVGDAIVDALLHSGEEAAKKVGDERVPELVQKLGENISVGAMHIVTAPVVGTYVHSNAKIGVIIGLEGGNVEKARDAAMHAAAMSPTFATPDDVTSESVEKEKEIWREQLMKDGKPEAMWDKIMTGKEKKFREENALVSQSFVKDPGKTVGQHLEGATLAKYVRVSVA